MSFLIIDLVLRVVWEGRSINVAWRHGTFRGGHGQLIWLTWEGEGRSSARG